MRDHCEPIPSRIARNQPLLFAIALSGNLFFERAIWIIYLLERGYSLLQVGLLESILHATMVAFEVPTGMVADLWGRKVSIIVGRVLLTVYLVGMVFASSFWLVAACFVVLGLGFTFISGADVALLYDSQKRLGRVGEFTRSVGLFEAAYTISLAFAMGVGGLMQSVSWVLVFGAGAAFQLVAAGACCLLTEVPAGEPTAERPTLSAHVREAVSFFRRGSAGRLLLMGMALHAAVVSTYHMFAQSLFARAGLAVAVISPLFALESLFSAGMLARAHRLESRWGSRKALLWTLGLGVLLFPLVSAGDAGLTVLAFFLLSVGQNAFYPVANSAINREIPSGRRATLLSVLSFTTSMVIMVLFPCVGSLAERWGLGRLLGLSGVAGLSAAYLCVFTFYRRIQAGEMEPEAAALPRLQV